MAHAKHKKLHKSINHPKKPAKAKKHERQTDITQFRSQLDALGLKIVQVTSDGNCLFRALADQLEGNEEEHEKYRHMVVQYIMKHQEEFEPFIEDEVPFDEYCKSMEDDGTWAGHMELQATSLVTRNNICIHRFQAPRWYIRNFHHHDAAMIHLSYHDGEHYNSVRLTEDTYGGRAKPIVLQIDAGVYEGSKKPPNDATVPASVKLVMSGTGCESYSKAEQVLRDVDGDIDAAIEYIIAEQGSICNGDLSTQNPESGNCEQTKLQHHHGAPVSNTADGNSNSTHALCVQPDNKKKSKEKNIPNVSKKKQKVSQSTTEGSSTIHTNNSKSNKSKGKQGLNCRKGDVGKGALVRGPGELPDMGSLCI